MTKPTIDSLRADWLTVQRFIRQERDMRKHVFRGQPDKLAAKVKAAEDALAAAERLKDAAKAAIPQQQPLLIDAVRKKRAKNGY